MCFGGSTPSVPKAQQAKPVPQIVAPVTADATAAQAGDLERRRRLAASGRSDTIMTSGLGDTSTAQVGQNQLLGR